MCEGCVHNFESDQGYPYKSEWVILIPDVAPNVKKFMVTAPVITLFKQN